MKIDALEVDGFGVWTELKLDPLGEGLTVFYGPNEAGKTTLLQFIRSVLYGFSAERRRYLPPLHGGKPGGSLWVTGPAGQCAITRHDGMDPSRPGDELLVFTPDGARHGEQLLKTLVCNVDEAVFNNVFAVGLRELQELAVLKDTEAAALLYNLTIGLDSVSLVEVMRELGTSRSRLVDPGGGPSQVVELLAQQEKLRAEITESAALSRRYAALAEERGHLEREIARLEDEKQQFGRDIRVMDIAGSLRDRWQKRRLLDDQWAALEPAEEMPQGAAERFDAFTAALQKRHRILAEIKRHWGQLRTEAAGLNLNNALLKNAPRIEALQEQEHWIAALQTQVSQLQTEIAEAETGLQEEQERLGLGGRPMPSLAPQSLAAMRRPAVALRRCRQKLEEARGQVQEAEQTARTLAEKVQSALSARGHKELGEATDRAGGLVSQLRRREQLDERLQQMHRRHAELEQQTQELMDREILPVSIIMGLGGVFVVGVILVLLKLSEYVLPTSLLGDLGWPMALLGLAATAAAVVIKFLLDHSNARQVQTSQRQIRMLQHQIQQTREERDHLDGQLPASGPATGRLQAAQRDLAGLEELVPLDAQRQAARREAEAAAARAEQAETDLATATRRWKEAVAAAGLPQGLSPKQVRELAVRCHHVGHSSERLQQRRDELKGRSEELRTLSERIAQLAKETGVGLEPKPPTERLHAMADELGRQRVQFQRRAALARQVRQLRRKHDRLDSSIARLQHRRRILLDEVRATDEQEFRRRAASHQAAQALRQERELLRREIEAAIAGQASEEELRKVLEEESAAAVETRRGQLQARLAACETLLRQRLEKRGQLAEQLRLLAEDRTPAIKQLELGTVQKRLREAVHQWQVLGVTAQVLETVRKRYEQTRQPECLQEASAHLGRMTQGRYQRVWTPLSDDVLMVDDAAGKPVPVEVLSHGVREQLFLSLRLALAGSYARRGAQLPMILDDVLVNFDAKRVKAAAAVLCELAATGHQLLVFTCHEHIARLFEELGVEVKELPDHAEPRPVATPAVKNSPQRADHKPRKRKAPAAERPYAVVAAADHTEDVPALPAQNVVEGPPPPPFEELPRWKEEDETEGDDCELADEDGDEEEPAVAPDAEDDSGAEAA